MRFTVVLLCCAAVLAGVGPTCADDKAPACPGHPAALGTSRVAVIGDQGPPELGLKTYPKTLALADHEVVLTFDDGPSRATTPLVLDALREECVHATFFLIGRNAAAAPQLVRREVADGHTVGHHTYSHPAVTERGLLFDAAKTDIDRGFAADDMAAYGETGPEPRVPFFRFPGFADTAELDTWLATRHIEVFGADLWASDWIPMTPQEEMRLLLERLERARRGIILLHDIKAQTAPMLPAFLTALKEERFRVVHLVPGHGPIATADAPPNWRSETEATLATLRPSLVKRRVSTPMPSGGATPQLESLHQEKSIRPTKRSLSTF